MEEIWKDIVGYEGKYQVSSMGRVKSLNYNNTRQERVIKLGLNKYGYLCVTLCKDGKQKSYLTHRLVAQAFISNPCNKPCVDHISTDKTDNRTDNLRWVTHKENSDNPLTKKHFNQKVSRKVYCENAIYDSIALCAEHYNVKRSTMKCWLAGRNSMPVDFQEKGLRYFIEKENDK